jgi:hypothetical protein
LENNQPLASGWYCRRSLVILEGRTGTTHIPTQVGDVGGIDKPVAVPIDRREADGVIMLELFSLVKLREYSRWSGRRQEPLPFSLRSHIIVIIVGVDVATIADEADPLFIPVDVTRPMAILLRAHPYISGHWAVSGIDAPPEERLSQAGIGHVKGIVPTVLGDQAILLLKSNHRKKTR